MTDDFYPREVRLAVCIIGTGVGLAVIGFACVNSIAGGHVVVSLAVAALGSALTAASAVMAMRNLSPPRYRRGFGDKVGRR